MRAKTRRATSRTSVHKRATGITPLKWNPRVACRTLDGTAFILLNSRMLRLNEVGTYIWECFENGATLDKVIEGVLAEFDTTATRAKHDAQAFVKELVQKEVLVPVAAKTQSRRSL